MNFVKLFQDKTFSNFKESIDNSPKKTVNGENKKELDTLLNLKFQLYDDEIYGRA